MWLRVVAGVGLTVALGCGRAPSRHGALAPGATEPGVDNGVRGDVMSGADGVDRDDGRGGAGDARGSDPRRHGDTLRDRGDEASGADARGGDGAWAGDPERRPAGDGALPGGDAAVVAAGVWLEINYRSRTPGESTATTDWSFSSTPGFGAATFAPRAASWPYIHTPDGGNLVSDPIGGTVLELGCYDRLRIFFGLAGLSTLRGATVTVEGRSRATSAGVDFEVWNPGASATWGYAGSMSQDWSVDIVTGPFAAEPGNDFQAVEISPSGRSCSLAIRRVRLTLDP
ncbi:MAG: hypothetical protein HY903_17670 [Deltaproteobacteria bacterium]|nr:hypothetical protein [Deltaproteobacteria bacterium]